MTLKWFIPLIIIVAVLFSLGLSNHGLWSADEPRVAEIGREMAETGNWAVPMLNKKPFLEEPPLYYGSLALAFKAFGVSDSAARIPSAVFCFGSVLALFFMANFLFGPRVAFISAIVLATAGEFFRVAHWVIVDSALTCFIAWAMACFIAGYEAQTKGRKLFLYALVYIFCTLAFYVKGFIGIVIPGLAVLVFLAFERNFRELVRMHLWLGVIIFAAMTFPWFMELWRQAGAEHLEVFFIHNHLQRFLPASMAGRISTSASGHHNPFYYYLTEFPIGFLPWGILLIPTIYLAFSKAGLSGTPSTKGRLFAKCWFFSGIIFLSIASTKRTLYLLPIFAPFAMLTGLYIDYTIKSGGDMPRLLRVLGTIFMWVFDIAMFLLGVAMVPAYLYFQKAYPSAIAGDPFIGVIIISLIVVVLALAAICNRLKNKMGTYWSFLSAVVIVLLGFILVAGFPILDRHKTFIPFSRAVDTAVPADASLYAYQPDETLRGAVPFYTGRYVTEKEEMSDVDALLQEKGPLYIMIRDRREKLEKELLATGKLAVLVKQQMGTDRTLVLFSNAPGKQVLIEDPLGRKARKR